MNVEGVSLDARAAAGSGEVLMDIFSSAWLALAAGVFGGGTSFWASDMADVGAGLELWLRALVSTAFRVGQPP